MATITPGTGGTLRSTTIEGALCEALKLLKGYEQDSVKNPANLNYVFTYSQDFVTNRIDTTWSIPVQRVIDSTGGTTYRCAEYLTSVGYAAGTGGTLKSTTLANVILEISEKMQELEANPLKNTRALNQLTGSIQMDTLTFTGSFSGTITGTPNTSGKTETTIAEYLLA